MKRLMVLAPLYLAILSGLAFAAEIHVAVDGIDTNPGTQEAPLASLARAVKLVQPGDTIWLAGGTYTSQTTLRLNAEGTESKPLRIWARPGERPILDFAGQNGGALRVYGAWWHLRGFAVTNTPDLAIRVHGDKAHHNTLENLQTYRNGNTGINISGGAAHNLVLNCDSWENFDPGEHGQDADGFGAKFDVGEGNRFVGCRAWNNSDDGYDCWHAGNGVEFVECYAWANGVNLWGDPLFEGNGNGFKLGQKAGTHRLIRCVAWDQPRRGFDLNGNSSGVTVIQCTAVRCGTNFGFTSSQGNQEKNLLRNNLSFDGPVRIDPRMDDRHNSWNIEGLTITAEDFKSLDSSSLQAPRKPDGSLPTGPFLQLAPGSGAIDAGDHITEPYEGTAPDLGAFESE